MLETIGWSNSSDAVLQRRCVVEQSQLDTLIAQRPQRCHHGPHAVPRKTNARSLVGAWRTPIDRQSNIDSGVMHRCKLRGMPVRALIADLSGMRQVMKVPFRSRCAGLVEMFVRPSVPVKVMRGDDLSG